jgi:hypothetical protein
MRSISHTALSRPARCRCCMSRHSIGFGSENTTYKDQERGTKQLGGATTMLPPSGTKGAGGACCDGGCSDSLRWLRAHEGRSWSASTVAGVRWLRSSTTVTNCGAGGRVRTIRFAYTTIRALGRWCKEKEFASSVSRSGARDKQQSDDIAPSKRSNNLNDRTMPAVEQCLGASPGSGPNRSSWKVVTSWTLSEKARRVRSHSAPSSRR